VCAFRQLQLALGRIEKGWSYRLHMCLRRATRIEPHRFHDVAQLGASVGPAALQCAY
jgi:hypothetical protein